MPASILDALRYDRWATLTLIDACRSLTKEQLEYRAPGTSGSIVELFTHLVGGLRTFALPSNIPSSTGGCTASPPAMGAT